ncbi:MAG TPA: phage recombination protein Bet [Gemmata sp.]
MSAPIALVELDEAKIALLKRTLCPDLTTDELELFAGVARRVQLDPFSKQIYAIKRKGKLTIQTGIDGFRVIAARTKELDGQDGPYWCGADGVWKDVWLDSKPPAAAKVVVYRKGCSRPFVGVARWASYCQMYDGRPQGCWATIGDNQIAKCAEALALRKAFPADLSGLYTSEEMEQAGDPDPAPVAPIQAEAKQLPPAPKTAQKPDADGIDRTADRAVKAEREGAEGDPLNDSRAMQRLAARKGWDWARLITDLNAKFKSTYSVTRTPWGDVAKSHREMAIKALRSLPDKDSAGDLERLLKTVAEAEKVEPVAVFQRYQVAAKLPDSCIRPEDLDPAQLVQACNSFRAKIAGLADIAGEGNGA